MDEIIVSVNTLPEYLHRRFRSEKVRVREEGGAVTLTPLVAVNEQINAIAGLRGMFKGRLSTDDYVAQKQIDKELEE